MKIHYDTPEEQEWLEKILYRAIMATDQVYEQASLYWHGHLDMKEYVLLVLELRAKIFEFLGQTDFNEETGTHKFIREKLAKPFIQKDVKE